METLGTVVGAFIDYHKPIRQFFLVNGQFSSYAIIGVYVAMGFGFVSALFAYFMLYLEKAIGFGTFFAILALAGIAYCWL
jgi:hypothetical protein